MDYPIPMDTNSIRIFFILYIKFCFDKKKKKKKKKKKIKATFEKGYTPESTPNNKMSANSSI